MVELAALIFIVLTFPIWLPILLGLLGIFGRLAVILLAIAFATLLPILLSY